MSGAQKISLSLLISIVVFSALAVLAAVDRFQVIETRFYIPRVEESVRMRAAEVRDVFDRFHRANIARFEEFTLEPAVRSAFRINASAAEIRERRNRLDTIEQERASLDLVRIIDVAATQLHYSSNPNDYTATGTQRTYSRPDVASSGEPRSLASLAYYEELPEAEALPSGEALPEPEIFLEAQSNQFIYRLPAVNSTGVLQGASLFYVNTSDLRTALIRAGLTGTGDVVRIVNASGVVANAPTQFSGGLSETVDRTWAEIADLDGRETVTTESETDSPDTGDASEQLVISYEAFPVESQTDGLVVFLEPSSSLQMPQVLQYTLLVAVFLTTFLIVFLLLNVRQDAIVVISDRVKRFQISLLREYMENRRELDFQRWKAELEDRRDEVQREIRRGIGRIKPSQEEEVDRLINDSWDEIISVLSSRAEERPTVSLDVERIEEIVDQLSRRLEQTGVGRAAPPAIAPSGPSPAPAVPQRAPAAPPAPGTPVEVEEVAEDEDLDEIEAVEEAEEIEEAGELEEAEVVEEPEPTGGFGTPVEVEEISEDEATGELGDVEELAEAEEVEPAEELEEVEEVDELEEAEIEEPEPMEAAPEELAEVEELDEAEEPEELAELDEAEEPEEPAELEEPEELDEQEVLDEQEEPAELVAPEPESTDVDERGAPADTVRPELPADVSLENLDEAAELEWLARAESAELPGPVFSREEREYEHPGLEEGAIADSDELDEPEEISYWDTGETTAPEEELEEVEHAEPAEEPEEIEEAEPVDELEAVEELEEAEEAEPVAELEEQIDTDEELEELEPEEAGGEAVAPEELPAVSAGSTTFGSGLFSFGRGVEVRVPEREPETAELETVPWEAGDEETVQELEEVGEGDEAEEIGTVEPVASGGQAPADESRRASGGLIRFQQGHEGRGDGYESASLSEVLDRLHIDKQVLVEHEGVVEIDRRVYAEGRTGHDEEMRSLVQSVIGEERPGEGSGIESLFGGGADELLSVLRDAGEEQRRERRTSQLSLFRFGEQGFDYDGFLRGYQDNEGGILKSLVRFTRAWNARIGILLVEEEHGLVPAYQLGLDPACADSLGITKSSGLYRHLLARRSVVFIEQPIIDVEYFHDLCSPGSLALFDRTLILPIVLGGANAYALLGLPRSVESLDDAFRAVVPYLSQAQGVPT